MDEYKERSSSYEYEGHESKLPTAPSPPADFRVEAQTPTTQAGFYHNGVQFDLTALDDPSLTQGEKSAIRTKQHNLSFPHTAWSREKKDKVNARAMERRRETVNAMNEDELKASRARHA
jgi:hypothetical protein